MNRLQLSSNSRNFSSALWRGASAECRAPFRLSLHVVPVIMSPSSTRSLGLAPLFLSFHFSYCISSARACRALLPPSVTDGKLPTSSAFGTRYESLSCKIVGGGKRNSGALGMGNGLGYGQVNCGCAVGLALSLCFFSCVEVYRLSV